MTKSPKITSNISFFKIKKIFRTVQPKNKNRIFLNSSSEELVTRLRYSPGPCHSVLSATAAHTQHLCPGTASDRLRDQYLPITAV